MVERSREAMTLGIPAVALFPVIADERKDAQATESTNPDGLVQTTVKRLKDSLPELMVITDVAMDPYSSDGHDGLVHNGKVLNDETLPILADMAVSQAEAGADIVAPSDMMDGRVGAIRQALDRAGHQEVNILAYSAKYASAFYGPFRDALDSAPRHGDKKTYQMDPANVREALREVLLDEDEGADMVMVKPALPYLDVIAAVKRRVSVPVAAYNVSGEYAMIKHAAAAGCLDGTGRHARVPDRDQARGRRHDPDLFRHRDGRAAIAGKVTAEFAWESISAQQELVEEFAEFDGLGGSLPPDHRARAGPARAARRAQTGQIPGARLPVPGVAARRARRWRAGRVSRR